MGCRGRPLEKFAELRRFVVEWRQWAANHGVEWTEGLARLRRCGARWLGYLCNLPTVDIVYHVDPRTLPDGPLPTGSREGQLVPFGKPRYQPAAPTLKHRLDEQNVLDETVRDVLQRMDEGTSNVLMIQTSHLRILSGSSWWAARVDAAATSETLKSALGSVRRQGMFAERRPWALCPICGCAFPVHRKQKTCDRCFDQFTPRERHLAIVRATGVDPVDLWRRDSDPDPFSSALMRELPEPHGRLQQRTADGAMVSVIFAGGEAGSIEANAVLRALALPGSPPWPSSGSIEKRIQDWFAKRNQAP